MHPEIEIELDQEVGERRLLDHPFYRAWSAGTLEKEDLAFYCSQYWHQVKAFPDYLTVLEERIQAPRGRRIVLSNLADELDDDHASLWVDFARAFGLSRASLDQACIQRETDWCVRRFRDAAAVAPIPFVLGMLYGYESQTPAVAAVKVEGLRDHFGISGEAVRYFEIHAELDVEHSDQLLEAIDEAVETRRQLIDAKSGARAGAEAVLSLLDGVCRARRIQEWAGLPGDATHEDGEYERVVR